MPHTLDKTILATFERSRAPLLVIPEGAGPDGFASAIGLAQFLRKLDKPVHIVTADKQPMEHLHFLEQELSKIIQKDLNQLQTFVIKLDISHTKAKELSYDVIDNKLHIFLQPQAGTWSQNDLKLEATDFKYDLIICIGAKNLEACGHLFEHHSDFFYRTPIINIDHSPHNEHFGHLNLVDMTACSVGEICHDWIESIAPELIDIPMATAFLTGMIAKTKSFRSPNVTPKTLSVASNLMAKGAKREEIVSRLFRTRSVETLRLWGRALARLKSDPKTGLVWTLLSQQDFLHAGSDEQALSGIIEELVGTSPQAKIALLIYEDREGQTSALVHTELPYDAIVLTTPFKPSGTHENVELYFPKQSIPVVEQLLTEHIKQMISK